MKSQLDKPRLTIRAFKVKEVTRELNDGDALTL